MALDRRAGNVAAAVIRSGSVWPGAERRQPRRQCAGFVWRQFRRPLSGAPIQGSLPDRQRKLRAAATGRPRKQTHRAGLARTLPGGIVGADDPLPASGARGSDHAGQPEILGLPLFRQQSEHRRTVPGHFQGRPQRPPQLRRPGLLAGQALQRQSRPDACPREFRRPQTRCHRGVLPWQRRHAGTRRARPPAGAATDHGFRRQCRALAPQLAVDAADSSAGKFWQPGGLKRFVAESAEHLAELYGDPRSAKAFAKMPIVIVGYSGGFVPTAWSLEVGGLGNRVRGVFLLDAVYGELDKFASWIENNRTGFFVSAYTRYTNRHDQELMQMLKDKGIAISEDIDGPMRPGSVVFVETPEGVTHRDYVTHAWTENPVKEVLVKMAATPALTRIAASAPGR